MSCWRRLRDWQEAGIWQLIHFVLLDWLARYGQRVSCGREEEESVSTFSIRYCGLGRTLGCVFDFDIGIGNDRAARIGHNSCQATRGCGLRNREP
jgi:hypothetical protein